MRTFALIGLFALAAVLIISAVALVHVPAAMLVAGLGVGRVAFVLDTFPEDSAK